jgi:hypothetical protein
MSIDFVNVRTQVGAEAVAGTGVAANRIITAWDDVSFDHKRMNKHARRRGSKYTAKFARGREYTEGKVAGDACFNGIIYHLEGLLPSQAAGTALGASGAFQRIYRPNSTGADARKTFTFENGTDVRCEKYVHGQLTTFGLDIGKDDAKMDSNFFAQKALPGQVITPAATIIPWRGIEADMINVYLDQGFANIGQTLLTDAFGERFSIGEKYKPKFVHQRSLGKGYKEASEIAPDVVFGITSEHGTQSNGWLTLQDSSGMMYLRIDIQGALIGNNGATPVYELIRVDVAGRFDAPADKGDQDGPWAWDWNFLSLDDPTGLGRPFEITIINTLSNL